MQTGLLNTRLTSFFEPALFVNIFFGQRGGSRTRKLLAPNEAAYHQAITLISVGSGRVTRTPISRFKVERLNPWSDAGVVPEAGLEPATNGVRIRYASQLRHSGVL